MELHTDTQMENISERVGNFPALGKLWLKLEVFVSVDQRVKDQFVQAFGLRIGSNSRIEIRRTVLDQHHDRVRIGAAGTGRE
jgi:hypothetical protein